jgi:hypothetical protein
MPCSNRGQYKNNHYTIYIAYNKLTTKHATKVSFPSVYRICGEDPYWVVYGVSSSVSYFIDSVKLTKFQHSRTLSRLDAIHLGAKAVQGLSHSSSVLSWVLGSNFLLRCRSSKWNQSARCRRGYYGECLLCRVSQLRSCSQYSCPLSIHWKLIR